jgi:DnaJ-domain-containing protein 1
MWVRVGLFVALAVVLWRWLRPRSDSHRILGVPPDADAATIRRAYQEKMHQFHPDKVASLAPELRALAEERTKELNAAYARLRGRAA